MSLSPPPVEHEPDHELDRQAAAEGLGQRAPKPTANGAPAHDTDAEEAALGSMLDSATAAATIIDTGLQPGDFYSKRNGDVYAAVIKVMADGHKPDAFTVAAQLDSSWAPADVFGYTTGHHLHYNAKAYATRILTCSRARRLQGHALEIATAAQVGQLDEALRRLAKLTDDIPDDGTHGWTPTNLADVLAGDTSAPVPTVLPVGDGPGLFYEGRTNMIFGEGGSGKTWIAVQAVAETILCGRTAIYIDLEDTPRGLVSRLLLVGLTHQQIADGLIYLNPEIGWSPTASASIVKLIDTRDVALVVYDSAGEAMAADGVKGNDDDDVARWFSVGPKYLARRGPTVLVIDHIPKDNTHAPLDPIGSQRKKAAIDGACYRIDCPKPPSIDHDGLLVAVVSKDRHGHHQRGHKAAQVAVTHPHPGTVELTVTAPEKAPTDAAGNFRPTVLMERVSRTVEDTPGLSQEQIVTRTTGKAKTLREAIGNLIREGFVEMDPTPGRFAYRSVKPFRAASDPVDNEQNDEESHAV